MREVHGNGRQGNGRRGPWFWFIWRRGNADTAPGVIAGLGAGAGVLGGKTFSPAAASASASIQTFWATLQSICQLPARGVPDVVIWYPIPFELKSYGLYRTQNVRYRKSRLSDIGTDLFM